MEMAYCNEIWVFNNYKYIVPLVQINLDLSGKKKLRPNSDFNWSWFTTIKVYSSNLN